MEVVLAVLVLLVFGVLALVVFVSILDALWRRLSKPRTRTASELYEKLDRLSEMDGFQFEHYTAGLLRALGYRTHVLQASGDRGVDVMATSPEDGRKIAVQCKLYKRRVGNKPVQEVYTGARFHGADEAWVVAPAGYTSEAREVASRTGTRLIELSDLKRWCKEIETRERRSAEPEQAEKPGAARQEQRGAGAVRETSGERPPWYRRKLPIAGLALLFLFLNPVAYVVLMYLVWARTPLSRSIKLAVTAVLTLITGSLLLAGA